jgi:hypothetical protein
VDEHGWLTSTDWLSLWHYAEVLTVRKRQLLAVAVCRQFEYLLIDPRSVRMMAFTEAWAEVGNDLTDGQRDEREDLYEAAHMAARTPGMSAAQSTAAYAAVGLRIDSHQAGRATIVYAVDVFGYLAAVEQGVLSPDADIDTAQAVWQHPVFVAGRDERGGAVISELIRELVGNPFRPVSFSPNWRTDTAVSLARRMYGSREFSAMPILADALQDAGCDDEAILAHCRSDGPHVRGCWVVDLVLGKS